uniref:RRP12-like protein n=1 Tax=Strombidium rassoulzadegani TaxID=1082188 RepID=A0A7S3FY61_9SPIT
MEQDDNGNDADHEVYIVKETGKFVVRDTEKEQRSKDEKKLRRRTEGYGADSDTDSDEETTNPNLTKKRSLAKTSASANELRKIIKEQKGSKGVLSALQRRNQASSSISKSKSAVQVARKSLRVSQGGDKRGHVEKFSGDVYKSAKGKGDVIKAGKPEPFSYIQLNPRVLNKRKKQDAIKSFSKVVTFGKKQDKRKGGLDGLKINYK